MRYLVTSQRRVLAVVGFGASAWKAAPRDRFIGWSVAQREARLQLVVNNARFLILPWVQVRNLASTVLARSSRRLPDDWQARYGYRPLLLETFVQSDHASPVPATAPPTGPMSVRPKAAANSTCIVPTRCPGKTSGSTRSGATSAADSAPLSILTPTSRTNIYSRRAVTVAGGWRTCNRGRAR